VIFHPIFVKRIVLVRRSGLRVYDMESYNCKAHCGCKEVGVAIESYHISTIQICNVVLLICATYLKEINGNGHLFECDIGDSLYLILKKSNLNNVFTRFKFV
jgi:hypothetical protein